VNKPGPQKLVRPIAPARFLVSLRHKVRQFVFPVIVT